MRGGASLSALVRQRKPGIGAESAEARDRGGRAVDVPGTARLASVVGVEVDERLKVREPRRPLLLAPLRALRARRNHASAVGCPASGSSEPYSPSMKGLSAWPCTRNQR